MNHASHQTHEHEQPSANAQAQAQLMFHRVVTGWAMDALSLRRRGLDKPGPRVGKGFGITPGRVDASDWAIRPAQHPAIVWRPPSDLAA